MSYNFTPFPILKTESLTLRKLSYNDVEPIFELRTNKEVNKFITRNVPKNHADTIVFIKMIDHLVANNKGIFWIISLTATKQLIGTIGLRNFEVEKNYSEIGYELNPYYQQKGYMSEALQEVLKFGFENLKFKTIEAFTHKNNKASIALLKKHHFVFQQKRTDEGFKKNRIFQLKKSS